MRCALALAYAFWVPTGLAVWAANVTVVKNLRCPSSSEDSDCEEAALASFLQTYTVLTQEPALVAAPVHGRPTQPLDGLVHGFARSGAPLLNNDSEHNMLDQLEVSCMSDIREQNDGVQGRLSCEESEGFFNETNDVWERRKERHIDQMRKNSELMTSCPESISNPECYVGCSGAHGHCWSNKFWQAHYEPSFSCLSERRIGFQGEGGKWVCDPHKIRQRSSCLVYSIGSNGRYDFETRFYEEVAQCEIHTVDMKPWQNYTSKAPPAYVNYHVYKIGPEPDMPISKLTHVLGHTNRTIDIFKIDCEKCEWATYRSWFDGAYIRQILVELHGTDKLKGAHEFFSFLFEKGYVPFHKEPNTAGCKGTCVEYSFVKLSPAFSSPPKVK